MCAHAVFAWLRADAPHAARPLTRRRGRSLLPDSPRRRVTSTTPPWGRQTRPRGTQGRNHQARASAGNALPPRAPLVGFLPGDGLPVQPSAPGRGRGPHRSSAPMAPGRVPLLRQRAVAIPVIARGASRYPDSW